MPSPQSIVSTFLSLPKYCLCPFAGTPCFYIQFQGILGLLSLYSFAFSRYFIQRDSCYIQSFAFVFHPCCSAYVSVLCSFLLLNISPFYGYNTSDGHWIVSIFCVLWIMLLWMFSYKNLCGHVFHFSST